MAPVAVPQVLAGDDARLAWKRTGNALNDANRRLSNSRGWYTNVRGRYGAAPLR